MQIPALWTGRAHNNDERCTCFCAGTDRERRCGGYLVQVAFLRSGNQTSTAGTTQEILDAGCQELCKLTQDLQFAGESQPNSGSWQNRPYVVSRARRIGRPLNGATAQKSAVQFSAAAEVSPLRDTRVRRRTPFISIGCRATDLGTKIAKGNGISPTSSPKFCQRVHAWHEGIWCNGPRSSFT